jgi:hypothetical protein
MAEYAGYVGNQVPPVDWGKIGTQLFDQYNEVKKDREEQRQKIEDDFSTTFQKIGEYESTTDQTINEYLYKGVDQARNALKTQYDLLKKGAISMADYKLKKNTLTTDWGNVSKALKNNAGIMESIQKMNASGEMSAVGRYRSEEYGKQLDIKDGQLYVNPETLRIYGTKANPQTGKVDDTSNVYSPVSMVNQYNIIDKKVDLNNGVSMFLKRVADYGIAKNLGGGRIELIENARQNPSYTKALDAQVNALTVTPFDVASVLADYAGGYQTANQEQKKELMAKGTPEDKIILMERVNGVLTPAPTKTQKEAAQAYVRDQIEVGVGQKEQMTQGYAPKQPRAVKADKIPESVTKRRDLYGKAVGMSETFRNDPGNPQVLSEIAGLYPTGSVIVEPYKRGNYVIGFNIFKKDADGNKVKGTNVGGTYDRIRIDPDAIYQRLTKDNRMGEEYGTSETAKRDWVQAGNDANRTLFDYKNPGKKALLD